MTIAQPGLFPLSHREKSLLIFVIVESGNDCANVLAAITIEIRNSIKLLVFVLIKLVWLRFERISFEYRTLTFVSLCDLYASVVVILNLSKDYHGETEDTE
jgi:hypothetical protein